jgi:hypothetical protein
VREGNGRCNESEKISLIVDGSWSYRSEVNRSREGFSHAQRRRGLDFLSEQGRRRDKEADVFHRIKSEAAEESEDGSVFDARGDDEPHIPTLLHYWQPFPAGS